MTSPADHVDHRRSRRRGRLGVDAKLIGIATAARGVLTQGLAADAELVKLSLTGRLATNRPILG